MKSLNRFIISSAIVAASALAAFAQTTPPATTATPTAPAASTQCDEQTNIQLYERWRNNRNGDAAAQKTASEAGREYLQKCTGTADAAYINAVKKWVDRYESVTQEFNYQQALSKNDAAEAFRLGRQLNASSTAGPRTEILTQLAWLGYSTSAAPTNASDAYNTEAERFAKDALAAIQAGRQPQCVGTDGKTTPCWAPFNSREDLIGGLHFAIGHFATKAKRFEDAATAFHAAAQQNGFTKTTASTYANLAAAYALNAEYLRLIKEYDALVKANPDAAGSEQAKSILARIDPHTDRIIDAYARAVALATDPKLAAQKADWMRRLTDFYKFRNNNSDAGLNELIAGISSRPMPPVATTLAPAPATTGAGNGATAPTPAATTTSPAATTGTTPPATTGNTPATTGTTPPATTGQPRSTTTTPPATTTARPKP